MAITIFYLAMPSGFRSAYSLWSCKAWAEVLYCGGWRRRGDRGLPAQPRPPWHANESTKNLFRRGPVWGSEFTSKDAALQGGDPAETAARLNVILRVLVTGGAR